MRKLSITAVNLLAAGMMLLGSARAQQTPAATTPPASATKPQTAPAAKSSQATAVGAQKAPAAKTGQPAKPRTQTPLVLKTDKDKVSYALGMNLGNNLHRDSIDIDTAILVRALKDALVGGKTLLTDTEARAALMQLQTQVRNKQMEKMKVVGEANKKEGNAFLAANKAKEGVVTLPSGLEYKILSQGTGPRPAPTDSVVCNYRGTLINGTEFDSSYKRGQPATFPVTGVIKGWTEALQLMPVGSKWQLFLPAELAYGERGPSPEIGPNSTLVFEVELLSIQAKEKEKEKEEKKEQ
jgi:FKBP-type peptidyl-prolyl cis-trans isomerase FklB